MLDKPLTFDGSALARNPIISADHTGGGLELPDGGSLTLVGVDIRDCPGPAVRMGAGTTFSATGCRFTGNGSSTGPSGGVVAGIWGWQTVSFVDCAVSENQSNNGGALHLTDYSSFKARDCTFSGNTAFSGGVLDCDGSQISLRRCLFNGNSATSQGGVVRNLSNDYPPFEIENCTFSGNEALNGAVFHGPWGNLSLRHCTVYGNYTLDGEAIELTGTNPDSFVISHSVFASNRTGTVGYRNFSGPAPTSTDHNIEDVHDFAFAGPGDRSNTQPLLGPLTWNGGTQRAHAPLALSPLIDAGSNGANTPSQDARGRTRNDDGDGDGLAAPDIGAYESGTPVVVTNIADENDNLPPYSLRDALVAVEAGGRILFDRSLNGGVIKLAASQGGLGTTLEIPRNVMIDATSLPNGVAISGNDSVRLFRISTNYDVSFHALTLRQGFGSTAGGALRNLGGNVTFNLCCLHDNTSSLRGGAIYCAGGSLLMENCTLANNESANQGGAVADDSASPTGFRFAHCTVAGNVSASGGGGIDLDSSPAEFLYTILSGNTNGSGARNLTLAGAAAVTSLGYNLESGTEAGFTATGDIQNGNAALGALANNGGFALTCALGTGSQAVDVSQFDAPPVPRTDGRGFNRYSYFNPGNTAARFIDIGAYEKNGDTYDTDADGLPDWWEAQCGLDLANAADAALDADSDGATALEEYQAETDPLDSGSVLQLTAFTFDTATGVAHLTWPVLPGRTYELWRTSDLATWTFFGNVNAPVGSTVLTRTISGFNPATLPRQFFRIQTQR